MININDELGTLAEDDVESTIDEQAEADKLINRDADENGEEDDQSSSSDRPSVNLDEDDPNMEIEPMSDKITHCKTCGNRMRPILSINGECPRCATKRMREIESRLIKLKQINPDNKYCVLDAHGVAYTNPIDPEFNKMTIMGVDFYPPGDLCVQCMTNLRTYFTRFLEDRGITRKGNGHEKNKFAETTIKVPVPEQLEISRRFEKFMLSVNAYANDKESGMADINKFYTDRQRQLIKKEVKAKWEERKEVQKKTLEQCPARAMNPRNEGPDELRKTLNWVMNQALRHLKTQELNRNLVHEDLEKISRITLVEMVRTRHLYPLALTTDVNVPVEVRAEVESQLNGTREVISYLLGPLYAVYVDQCLNSVVKAYNEWILDLASELENSNW